VHHYNARWVTRAVRMGECLGLPGLASGMRQLQAPGHPKYTEHGEEGMCV